MDIYDPITNVAYIGATYAKRLAKLDIHTVLDLLLHYPHRYADRRQLTTIAEIVEGEETSITAEVISFKNVRIRGGKTLQNATVRDKSGILKITWFNQPYLENTIKVNQWYAFSGKGKMYRGNMSLTAPVYERVEVNSEGQILTDTSHTGKLVPVYPETAGLSSKWIRSRIKDILKKITITDFLDSETLNTYQLIDYNQAIKTIHRPQSEKEIAEAKDRLGFNEVFLIQLQGAIKRYHSARLETAHKLRFTSKEIEAFIKKLPFTLTDAQNKAIEEILEDLKKQKPMNRLVEGDVGSGKTVVAAVAMYITHLNGLRSVLMAPTEILALQHYQGLQEFYKDSGVTIGLKTASQKVNLDADVVVGTHALLFNIEKHSKLATVVIDEQHRFGVSQRAKLENLGFNPHRLTMSATPIPRTVALTIYGDLDISIIDQMPKNRKPIKTWVVPDFKRKDSYKWIRQQVKAGDQVFVVCPLIEASEAEGFENVKSAVDEFAHLNGVFPELKIELLHGRLKADEKNAVIDRFSTGKTDILVSTQVIEVGIDVPNATIMIIESADRFGLAQLHQLRGRVGRGDKQGYCFLFSSSGNQTSRLKALTKYNSGFTLAEIDLKLRGAGEVFGTSQHGFSQFKFANFSDKKLIASTRKEADKIVKKDPDLDTFPVLKNQLQSQFHTDITLN